MYWVRPFRLNSAVQLKTPHGCEIVRRRACNLLHKWLRKFHLAGRGVFLGMQGQNSFAVHLPVALAVVILAAVLGCELWQWCTLGLCIGLVLSAELANSAIEELAKGLCHEQNPRVGRALDIASGAVLMASICAGCIGAAIFISRVLFFVS